MTARRFALSGAAALALIALPAAPASAHTELTGSSPADGARISAPARVALKFNEDLQAGLVKVTITGANKETWQRGAPKVTGAEVVQNVMPDLPAGAYTIGYRVVSEDGHPVTGTLAFTVVAGPATAQPTDLTPVGTGTPVPATSEGGGARWLMVGVGLAAGAGIGILFSMRRKRG
ncbi:copper resistance protein CopC [Actinocorallia lasiicapitis]